MPRRPSSPRLVGRAAELAHLADGFRRAVEGQPSFLLLSGEAGVGKTRLVTEHARAAAAARGLVLIGECIEFGETSLPYGPFSDALASLPGPAADAIRGSVATARLRSVRSSGGHAGGSIPPEWGDQPVVSAEFFGSVMAAVEQLAAEHPVLLVFDDIHWIDSASQDLLAYLARRVRSTRLQVIATYRSDALHRRHRLRQFLAEAERWPTTDRLHLDRLDRAAVGALLESIVGQPPTRSLVDRIYERSDGNPFFTEELLASEEAGRRTAGGTLAQVFDAQLDGLSDEARGLLEAAAVLGRRPEHDLLIAILGGDDDRALAAIRECVANQLLLPIERPGTAVYEFRHALVQEHAYDELLPTERTALHRRAAAALSEGVDLSTNVQVSLASEIAYHAYRAHDRPLALRAAEAAGRAAALALAFSEADRQFALAIELWDEVPAEERPKTDFLELLGRAAWSAAYAGDPHRAARYQRLRIALTEGNDLGARVQLLHELFWYLWEASDVDAYPSVAEEAAELMAAAAPSPARARALADLGFSRWSICDHVAAEALAREAVEVARAAGDPGTEGTGLQVLAMALTGLGRTREADPLFAAALERLRDAGDADGTARAAHWWADSLELDGSFERALAIARQALEDARSSGGDDRHGDALRAVAAENLSELGRWEEALATSAEAFDWGEDVPSEVWLHAVHSRISIWRGDLAEAARHIAAVGGVPALGPERIWQLEEQISLAYATGELDEARAALSAAIAAAADPSREAALWWTLWRAMDSEAEASVAARVAGDLETAEACSAMAIRCADLLEASGREAQRAGGTGPLIGAYLAWVEAERARLDGRPDPDAWKRAVEAREAIAQPYDAALGRVRLAEALSQAGASQDELAPVLDRARATAETLGLTPVLAALDRLEPGRRRQRVNGRAAGTMPVDEPGLVDLGLSPRELEVLALVAVGRTNREIGDALFISAKTASVHITHILDKLGVSSRVEAALLAASVGLAPADAALVPATVKVAAET